MGPTFLVLEVQDERGMHGGHGEGPAHLYTITFQHPLSKQTLAMVEGLWLQPPGYGRMNNHLDHYLA
jgi:hypothetical protein